MNKLSISLNPLTYINIPVAIFGASFLGGTVFYINYHYGVVLASIAAGKQAVYTFFCGGIYARLCEKVSLKLDKAELARMAATILCTTLASGVTLFVHSLRGTPEPVFSTLPTLLSSFPAFFILAWWTQRQDDGSTM